MERIVLECELNPKESWWQNVVFLHLAYPVWKLLLPNFKTRFVAKPPSLDLTSTSICSPVSPLYFIPRVLKSIICTSWLYLLTSFLFSSWLGPLLSRSAVTYYLPVARSNRHVCFYLTYSNTWHSWPCLPSWSIPLGFHVTHSWFFPLVIFPSQETFLMPPSLSEPYTFMFLRAQY